MKVTISAARSDHSYKTALAMQEAGILDRYYTQFYFKPQSLLGSLLVSLSKNSTGLSKLTARLYSNRYMQGLKPQNVVSLSTPEFLGRAWRHIPLLRKLVPGNKICDNLFDLLVSRQIKNCDIFHGWLGYSLHTLERLNGDGTKILIDMYAAHPHFRKKLLSEEYERLNLNYQIPDHPLWKKYLKEIELADHLITPSPHVYKTCVLQGVPKDKITIIPFGVDIHRFKPTEKKDNIFRVIYVGAISINKGIYYLLEAFKQIDLPHSELVLIGRLQPEFKPIISKYDGLFQHISHVPNDQLANWYGNSSVFAFPSLTEGSALVTYEAVACGIPSIVTENSGSVVRDKEDGFVIPIRDIESLKDRILFFYNNEEKRKEMGKSARKRAEQFTWERYGQKLIEFYESIYDKQWKDNFSNQYHLPLPGADVQSTGSRIW
jgi:glycosyltransferase involved in cell wall biosynthesis